MDGHPPQHPVDGSSNAEENSRWNTAQYNPTNTSGYGGPDVQPAGYEHQDGAPEHTFQGYQPNYQQQQPGYAAASGYWGGSDGSYQQHNYQSPQQYPSHYDDPNAGPWTGTGVDLYTPEGGYSQGTAQVAPDLFSAGPSMENSGASSDLHVAAEQPDMLPHDQPTASTAHHENTVNQPPDMLPTGSGGGGILPAAVPVSAAHDVLEERMLVVDVVEGSASGPDILSNGMRGDERTRPDILSPGTGECSPGADALSGSRSSSAVLHSPTGAFEPVIASNSRTGSISESDHPLHHPHTAATAAPLWEQPTLPVVQLQPVSSSTVPVQLLPPQMLQTIAADPVSAASGVTIGEAVHTAPTSLSHTQQAASTTLVADEGLGSQAASNQMYLMPITHFYPSSLLQHLLLKIQNTPSICLRKSPLIVQQQDSIL